jgi:fatty-acyl-CoA synthase
MNTRLSPDEIRYVLQRSGSRVLIVDSSLALSVQPIVHQLDGVTVVTVANPEAPAETLGVSYQEFLDAGGELPLSWDVDDELATIAINYTSGTTGSPKGVMYTHRGAYLAALAQILHSEFDGRTVYLWTLPMFHCNGWCTAWAVSAVAGTHVCLEAVRADRIWELLAQEGVTHLNGAPTVLTMIANSPLARELDRPLTVTTAGAPPSPTTIAELTGLGARIIHVYGLTETYGPYTICEYQDAWSAMGIEERSRMLSRQGVGMITAGGVRVVDARMRDVPADGETMGEIVMRGNLVTSGYYSDPEATAAAFAGGWFHSGDLGVMHPDGYIQLRDRAKDVVISGGENISTVEVEQALISHPSVLESSVIGVPDERWGEACRAYVVLKPGASADESELIDHVRGQIARFKAPKRVIFVPELPKTTTGKVQKFVLRDLARSERE